MARRSSNRDRIGRMREEVAATADEKKTRAANPAPGVKKKRRPAPSGRMKAVWGVKDSVGKIVLIYPYPMKAAAEAEAARMREAGQRGTIVCPHKVPFED